MNRSPENTGLFALRVPSEHGGAGGSIADVIRVVAALAEADASIAQMYITHTYGVELLNQVEADAGIRGRLLSAPHRRRAVHREWLHTERGTKTIYDFKTRLDPDSQGGWRMNGTKFYGTGSVGGDVIYASGKVGGGGMEGTGDGRRDLGEVRMVFLERDTPGVTIHDDWDGMGQRTTSSGTIELRDVQIPDDRCFGTEGFDSPDSLFSLLGQAGFAAVFVGIAKAALTERSRALTGVSRKRRRSMFARMPATWSTRARAGVPFDRRG